MNISDLPTIIQKLNVIDYVLIVILLFTFIRGLFVGFIRSILTLIGVIVAFVVSANYHVLFSETFLFRIQDALVRNMISSLLIFFSVYILFWISSILIDKFFKVIGLGWLNSLLGGLFGLTKGLIFCAVILFSITIILSPKTPILNNSYFYPQIGNISKYLSHITREDLREKFFKKWNKIMEKLKEKDTNSKGGSTKKYEHNRKNT